MPLKWTDYKERLPRIPGFNSQHCLSQLFQNLVPSSILYRYQDRSAHTHICIYNTHTHQRLLKSRVWFLTPHHMAHNCLYLQLQGIWLILLATSGNCTHMHMIKTNKPWSRARVSEERPGEATGQSAVHLQRRPQQFRDASTMPDIAAAAAAVGWSQSEPRRQVVCAALRGAGEVTQDLWSCQNDVNDSQTLGSRLFSLLGVRFVP